jgi:hypothetical protein
LNLTGFKISDLTSRLAAPFRSLGRFVATYVKAHHIRRGGFVALAATAAVLFFVIGAFIRLLVGPVSLGPFSDRLSEALAHALPGLTVRYDQAAIEWSRDDGRVNLVVLGARVFDSDGRIIAQAPKAELALAAAPLLLHGDVELKRIALVGVQLTLVRTRDGQIQLGVTRGRGSNDILKRITDAINASNSKQSSLQTFAVHQARIAFLDQTTGLFLVAPRADLQVETAGVDLKATLDADIEVSGKPARVKISLNLPSNKRPVSGEISFTGLSLDALGNNAKAFDNLKGLKLTTDLSASFELGADNRLRALDFGVGASGTIAVRGLIHGPMRVQTIRAVGKYDGAAGRVLVDDIDLSSDGANAHGVGQIDIARDNNTGTINRVAWDFSMDKIAVNMPGLFLQPFRLNSAELRAAYIPEADQIAIEHFGISGGPFNATASGTITRAGEASPAIEMQASVGALGVRDLLRYWPKTLASGAWEWVDKNMKSGRAGPISAKTHISAGAIDAPALPEASVDVSIPLSGVTMTYFHQFTPMTNVAGTAHLTGDTFAAKIGGGHIGSIVLSDGSVTIPNLHGSNNVVDIVAHGEGKLSDILTLIDMEPLHYATRFHLNPKDTLGNSTLDINFHVPTGRDVADKDIKIGIKSALNGLDLQLTPHARITNGALQLTIDNAHLNAVGDVMLFGSRLAVNWDEQFEPARNTMSSHISLKGMLDDATREALNFHSGQFLKGTVPVTAELTGQSGQVRHADMIMDVTPAVLTVDYVGITKPAGAPATAVVSADFDSNGTIQSETVKLTGTIVANGTINFDKEGSLSQISFPSVHAGPLNDFAFNMTEGANGALDISVRGKSLDGTGIGSRGADGSSGQSVGSDSSENTNQPFHISARLDRLAMRNGVAISPFSLDVSGFDDRPQTLSVNGALGKSPVEASITAGEGGRHIAMSADDAGTLLNGLFGFTSMKGGKLALTGNLQGRGDTPHAAGLPDYQGTATITDFRIVDQPFLTRLFSAGSLTGIAGLLGGRGIQIDKLTVPFSSRNGVVSIREARASGGAIGMTADGYIDRPKNQVALKGSLIPIFGLNSVLGAIPLLGNLLVSKKGEGVFGMTYSATGNADEPKVSINPLSMLTPGIFRRIFEGRIPEDAQISQLPQSKTVTPAPSAATPTAPTPSATDQAPASTNATSSATQPSSTPAKKRHKRRHLKPA